jgi:hypothetical protein
MVIKWMARLVAVVLILTGLMQVFAQEATLAPDAESRTYQPPDSDYRFTYPLDSYSVRAGCTCQTPDQGQNILFPGVVEIAPNDSLVYRGGQGTVYKISIAATSPAEAPTLDATLFGTGPLVQYDPSIVKLDQVQEIQFGDTPGLRVDDLPVGQNGLTADILVVYNNILYEIVVEPVNVTEGGGVKGKNLLDDILNSIKFTPFNPA